MQIIEDVSIKDFKAIAECEILSKQESFGESSENLKMVVKSRSHRWHGYLTGTQHPQKAKPERTAYKIESNDEIVAYIAGHLSSRFDCEGELQSIYIRKQFQRQGLGAALLRKLFNWFFERRARKICVGIDPSNPYRQFYFKHGATELNRHYLYWENIGMLDWDI